MAGTEIVSVPQAHGSATRCVITWQRAVLPCLLAVLLALTPNSRLAASEPRVTILAEYLWPYAYTDTGHIGGEPTGISVQFAREVLDAAGLRHETSMLPWSRVLMRAEREPNCLITAILRTPAREDQYHWVGKVGEEKYALFGLASRAADLPSTLATARDAVIAATPGDALRDYLESRGFTRFVSVSDHLQGMQLVVRGRVDLFPADHGVVENLCETMNIRCEEMVPAVPLEDLSVDLYLAYSQSTPNDIVERTRRAYSSLMASGRREEIDRAHRSARDR